MWYSIRGRVQPLQGICTYLLFLSILSNSAYEEVSLKECINKIRRNTKITERINVCLYVCMYVCMYVCIDSTSVKLWPTIITLGCVFTNIPIGIYFYQDISCNILRFLPLCTHDVCINNGAYIRCRTTPKRVIRMPNQSVLCNYCSGSKPG